MHFVIANSPTWLCLPPLLWGDILFLSGLSVCLSVCPDQLPHLLSDFHQALEFKIMMCVLCSITDFIVHWVLPLLCLFGLTNFETIQYALCHRKFSYMINQKFMKLCTLQDPNMKMCTLVGYPGPLSFTPVMLLWVHQVLPELWV